MERRGFSPGKIAIRPVLPGLRLAGRQQRSTLATAIWELGVVK
jgi:hypothetical protein